MDDTTIIAIVAVVMAGVVGPALTSYLDTRREGKRLDRELLNEWSTSNRAELRELVDEIAADLDALARQAQLLRSLFMAHAWKEKEPYDEPFKDTGEAMEQLRLSSARLSIRLGRTHPLAEVCERARSRADDLRMEIWALLGLDHFDAEAAKKIRKLPEEVHRARIEYLDEAHRLFTEHHPEL